MLSSRFITETLRLTPNDKFLLLIAAGGLVALFAWFFNTSTQVIETTKIGAIYTDGTVRRRQSRSLQWGNIQSEGTLFQRDTIYNPAGTQTMIVFKNGTEIELKENTMVQFDELAGDELDVVLLKGDVALRADPEAKVAANTRKPYVRRVIEKEPEITKPEAPSIVVEEPAISKALQWKLDAADQFFNQIPDHLSSITKLEPLSSPKPLFRQHIELRQKLLSHLEKPLRLKPLTKVDSSLKQLQLKEFDHYRLRLIYPTADTAINLENGCARFVWSPMPSSMKGVEYYLQISRDSQFRFYRTYYTQNNHTGLQLDADGRLYYWRVRAEYRRQTLQSDAWAFKVNSDANMKRKMASDGNYLPTWKRCNQ